MQTTQFFSAFLKQMLLCYDKGHVAPAPAPSKLLCYITVKTKLFRLIDSEGDARERRLLSG